MDASISLRAVVARGSVAAALSPSGLDDGAWVPLSTTCPRGLGCGGDSAPRPECVESSTEAWAAGTENAWICHLRPGGHPHVPRGTSRRKEHRTPRGNAGLASDRGRVLNGPAGSGRGVHRGALVERSQVAAQIWVVPRGTTPRAGAWSRRYSYVSIPPGRTPADVPRGTSAAQSGSRPPAVVPRWPARQESSSVALTIVMSSTGVSALSSRISPFEISSTISSPSRTTP